MNTAVIGLGSNIQPVVYIEKAKKLLASEFQILKESQFKQTKPIGTLNQPDFLNGAILIETGSNIKTATSRLKQIENKLGRIRTTDKNGPRTIDLDILVWNDKIIDSKEFQRQFIKNSVLELLPNLVDNKGN